MKVQSLFGSATGLSQIYSWGTAMIRTGVITRIFNAKPIWAQLKITDKCNLSCGYCSEHDRHGRHVESRVAVKWISHCSRLGVKHVELIGGEPLMHPQIIPLLRYIRQCGMNTGLTTNGYLLTEKMAEDLIDAGISRLQLSIDCIDPNAVTKKALNSLQAQIDTVSKMKIWAHVNSVVSEDTLPEAKELASRLFETGIPVAFSPAHKNGQLDVKNSDRNMESFFSWLLLKKDEGLPVNMPRFLIEYYRSVFRGENVTWTCEGGCKAFYVDSEGMFRLCSHKSTGQKFESIGKNELRRNHSRKKGCESSCGVSCMITNSFPFCRTGEVVMNELFSRKAAAQPCTNEVGYGSI